MSRNAQKYYLVNGIQGLKLNSKAGNGSLGRSRPPSRAKSAIGDNSVARQTSSRPSTAKSTPGDSTAVSSDALDGDVIIHVFDENRNGNLILLNLVQLIFSSRFVFKNHNLT